MNALVGVMVLGALVGLFVLIWYVGDLKYTPSERNPYVRYCKRCGQQQAVYSDDDSFEGAAVSWWEPMGLIHDAACRCHKDCPEHARPALLAGHTEQKV